ncbi:kinase-like domain-containing protein [Aspergillus crustosus]
MSHHCMIVTLLMQQLHFPFHHWICQPPPLILSFADQPSRFNEKLHLAERHAPFNASALSSAICASVNRRVPDLNSITKLAEGGYNRVLEARFGDGYSVLAEAATLGLLRAHGIPVPGVLAYSADAANAAGSEYLILEKLEGEPLGGRWFTMDNKSRVKVMRQIVQLESRLMRIQFPAWLEYRSALEAPARRETEYCTRFGKPRLRVERYLQELQHFQTHLPETHINALSGYLKLSPHLDPPPPDHPVSRPTLRHPDFSPNNILQHPAILPLSLCAGIPDHFQNWGDPVSESLAKPDVKLPDTFQALSDEDQQTFLETRRKRLVYFYYAALMMNEMPDHFDALRNENSMLRAKLFQRAGAPWEGDTLLLRYAIIQAMTNWPMSIDNKIPGTTHNCHGKEGERMQELSEMRDIVGIDSQGWVPDDEHLQRSKVLAQQIKEGLLGESSTDIERTAE